jgi:hypothetical protein
VTVTSAALLGETLSESIPLRTVTWGRPPGACQEPAPDTARPPSATPELALGDGAVRASTLAL